MKERSLLLLTRVLWSVELKEVRGKLSVRVVK